MPVLRNPRQERFAQEIANGKSLEESQRIAGYSPNRANGAQLKRKEPVATRITEILAERAAIHEQAVEQAVKSVRLSKEWIIEKLIQNVDRAMQVEEVKLRDGTGTGQFVYNGAVANKALELLGREIGMFIERHEVGGAGDFARLNDQELLSKALTEARAMGATPVQLAAIRTMFDPTKQIEGTVEELTAETPREESASAD